MEILIPPTLGSFFFLEYWPLTLLTSIGLSDPKSAPLLGSPSLSPGVPSNPAHSVTEKALCISAMGLAVHLAPGIYNTAQLIFDEERTKDSMHGQWMWNLPLEPLECSDPEKTYICLLLTSLS